MPISIYPCHATRMCGYTILKILGQTIHYQGYLLDEAKNLVLNFREFVSAVATNKIVAYMIRESRSSLELE